jgi:hypothetical protein
MGTFLRLPVRLVLVTAALAGLALWAGLASSDPHEVAASLDERAVPPPPLRPQMVPMLSADSAPIPLVRDCGFERLELTPGTPVRQGDNLTAIGVTVDNPCGVGFDHVRLKATVTVGGQDAGTAYFYPGSVPPASSTGGALVLPGFVGDIALRDIVFTGGQAVDGAPTWRFVSGADGLSVAAVTGLASQPFVSFQCRALGRPGDYWSVPVNDGNALTQSDIGKRVVPKSVIDSFVATCPLMVVNPRTGATTLLKRPAGSLSVDVNPGAAFLVDDDMYTPGAYYNLTGRPVQIDSLMASVKDPFTGRLFDREIPVDASETVPAGGFRPILLKVPAIAGTVVGAAATSHAIADAGWFPAGAPTVFVPHTGQRVTFGAAFGAAPPGQITFAGFGASGASRFVVSTSFSAPVRAGQYVYLTDLGLVPPLEVLIDNEYMTVLGHR